MKIDSDIVLGLTKKQEYFLTKSSLIAGTGT